MNKGNIRDDTESENVATTLDLVCNSMTVRKLARMR
jgi:hypothetical protein